MDAAESRAALGCHSTFSIHVVGGQPLWECTCDGKAKDAKPGTYSSQGHGSEEGMGNGG